MFQTIQSRMVLIFLAFTLLLAAGGGATYVVLTQQADDGLVVNLAGRQRMLSQKLTKEAMQLGSAAALGQTDRVTVLRDVVKQTARVFESTLFALRDGGPAPTNLEMTKMRDMPAPQSEDVKRQLETVAGLWQPFKANIDRLLQANGKDLPTLEAIGASEDKLLSEMNGAVVLMQTQSEGKVKTLYMIQTLALALGVLLVIVGAWTARSSIAKPISDLTYAAREMSTGNLKVEFHPTGTREVQELGASFDRMRASMIAAFGGALATADDDV
jgi:methyl-accepting chemotaxis protein